MLRLLFTFIGLIIFLAPAPLFAGEGQKSEVISLYKSYRGSLKEGKNEVALKFAEQMYALTPGAFGKISKTHATATFNLAQINDLLKNHKAAAELYQQHIDILDKLKVPKDKHYLVKLGLLAAAYMKINNFSDAAMYGRKALGLAKDLKVTDKILAVYELKLGTYYYLGYGKGRRARQHINKAVELFTEVYGDNDARTAWAIFWRAKLDMGFKKNRRAAEEFEHVLDIYNKELDAGDDRILQVHAFLVNVYEKLGEKEKSTQHCIAVATERPTGFDRDLDPLYKITPTYPDWAQMAGMSGYIIAEFTVNEFGQVKDIKTIGGKNIKYFEKNAYKALSQFRYAPTIRDGKRVRTEGVKHKITFEMEN